MEKDSICMNCVHQGKVKIRRPLEEERKYTWCKGKVDVNLDDLDEVVECSEFEEKPKHRKKCPGCGRFISDEEAKAIDNQEVLCIYCAPTAATVNTMDYLKE